MHSNWETFKILCRVIGGQDSKALTKAHEIGILQQLFAMADQQDLLPALAMRIEERPELKQAIADTEIERLQLALRDNTRRNMQIVMQALKMTRALNSVGITPTFLKGTAQLLTVNKARLGFRKQLDIDLVVAPDELKTTCQVMLDTGYGFYRETRNAKSPPETFHNIEEAFKTSAAHHHLPAMVIDGYGTCVELHRHFLPRRFQRKNPLKALLDNAHLHESHDAAFWVPSAEYQLIHIILGKLINDSYLARRDFPIREACDYIELLGSVEERIDGGLVTQHCGRGYAIFSQLVTELMAYKPKEDTGKAENISRRLRVMEKRYNSGGVAKLLNTHARAIHLSQKMVYSPAKLPAYLQRLGKD